MNRALYAAATGMAAQQFNLETIASNLSNADVAGFKGATATFSDIALGDRTLGVTPTGTKTSFIQGKLARSNGEFDIAIDGNGFFCVRGPHGERGYTRGGEFTRSPDGTLRNAQGWRLDAEHLPANANGATVAPDGTVSAQTAQGIKHFGRVRVYDFAAPEQLQASGGSLFLSTKASGEARAVKTGVLNAPSIRFGMLEQSNVTIVEAMMQIMAAQRSYEANAKGVQAADEMLRIANNLSRG